MPLYTRSAIHVRSTLKPFTVREIPWDSVRVVKLRFSGKRVTRCVKRLTEDMPAVPSRALGLIRRSDVGRILVVDLYEDGDFIDVLVTCARCSDPESFVDHDHECEEKTRRVPT